MSSPPKKKGEKTNKGDASHDDSHESKTNKLKVAVRVRPANAHERNTKHKVVVKVIDNNRLAFDPTHSKCKSKCNCSGIPKQDEEKNDKDMCFIFDNVFDSGSTNDDIFEGLVRDLIASFLDGYNCAVFFYGATGTGKTHTMFGKSSSPGIIYLTVQELFDCLDLLKSKAQFKINVSYLEVYKENIYDLLRSSKSLKILDNGKNGLVISGLYYPRIRSASELIELIRKGNVNRTHSPTAANGESSRGHAVFQIYIKMKKFAVNKENRAKLSMTDLAGSERASTSTHCCDRSKETAFINKNFLTLGNCLNCLANGSKFIPYRDSKLTRLLKDTLGGNCRTIMIANIAPTNLTSESTLNTLKYASRAGNIESEVSQNSRNINQPKINVTFNIPPKPASEYSILDTEIKKTNSDKTLDLKNEIRKRFKMNMSLLKNYLELQSLEKINLLNISQKHRINGVIRKMYINTEDGHLRGKCEDRINELETEIQSLADETNELNYKVKEAKNQHKIHEEEWNDFINNIPNKTAVINSFIEALHAVRFLYISGIKEKHLTFAVKSQEKEMEKLINFLNNYYNEY